MKKTEIISWYNKYLIPPKNIPKPSIRFFVIMCHVAPVAGFFHILFIFYFMALGVYVLAYFNILSVLIWTLVFFLVRNGWLRTSWVLNLLEINVHAILCVHFLGWDFGFQYYLLPGFCGIFLRPPGRKVYKFITFFILCGSFIGLFYYDKTYEIIRDFNTNLTILSNIVNITAAICVIAICLLFFRDTVDKAEAALEFEHQKAENLLYNILPVPIANRLKEDSKTIADGFKQTSVLFADIVGFTELSEKISPDKLVQLLNNIFSIFDDLADNYNLEKIKTIGDAYMIAAGIPEEEEKHAAVIADFALDILDGLSKFNEANNSNHRIRIGINSGPVVAGVIGKKKFIYDLWGDAVNTAARMESHGIPGEIQVTESTYNLLKEKYVFEERGEIEVKGKGKLRTFLLKRRKQ
jgi:class 3 adenylate cyclase